MAKFVLTAQLRLQAPQNTQRVINQLRSQLKGIEVPVEVAGAARAQKQINQVADATKRASSEATNLARSFGLATKRFVAFTIASRAVSLFTNSLSNAVAEAIDFQREIVKVAQVTGKTVKELKGLRQTIGDLATGLGASSKDLVAVTRILSQAGIKATDLNVALEALAKTTLAPTFDDITETAEGAVAILAQFEKGVGSLEKQLGSINAVAGQFAVESGDLIGAVRRFGGVFKAAGGELEELIAVFTAVRATTRESAESISTGLRTIFTRIQRPKTIEFLKQFGIELTDLEGKFVGPFEATRRLSEALKGLEEGDLTFIRIAEELGGFRQIGKVIPLLREFTTAEQARQAALRGSNSLDQDAATAQQALAVQILKVKEEFAELIRKITESTGFQLFVKTTLSLASAFIQVADALRPLLPLIATFAAFKIARGFSDLAAGFGSAFRGVQSLDPQRRNSGGRVLGFNRGGFVPGSGDRDTIPAMLTPGEFVIKKRSAQKLGAETLERLNTQRFNDGGVVLQPSNTDRFGAFIIREGDGGLPIASSADGQKVDLSFENRERLLKKIALRDIEKTTKGSTVKVGIDDLNLSKNPAANGLRQISQGPFRDFLLANAAKLPGVRTQVGGKLGAKGLRILDNNQTINDLKSAYEKSLTVEGKKLKRKEKTDLTNKYADFDGDIKIRGPFPIFQIGGGLTKKSPSVSIAADKADQAPKTFQSEIKNAAREALTEGVTKVSQGPLRDAVSIPPGLIGGDFEFSSFYDGAAESVEGFLLEGIIGAITGARVGGGTESFDFPKLRENPESKSRLQKLFQDASVKNLRQADAKRRRSTANSGEGKLTNKIGKFLAEGDVAFNITKKPQGFNAGGKPTGPDTIPALLTPGEFVINKKAAQAIGYGNLKSMNQTGVEKFNSGGVVGLNEGGIASKAGKVGKFLFDNSIFGIIKKFVITLTETLKAAEKKVEEAGQNFEDAKAARDQGAERLAAESPGLQSAIDKNRLGEQLSGQEVTAKQAQVDAAEAKVLNALSTPFNTGVTNAGGKEIRSVDAAELRVRELETRLNPELSGQSTATGETASQIKNEIAALKESINTHKSAQDEAIGELEQYEKELAGLTTKHAEYKAAADRSQAELDKLTSEQAELAQAADDAEKAYETAGKELTDLKNKNAGIDPKSPAGPDGPDGPDGPESPDRAGADIPPNANKGIVAFEAGLGIATTALGFLGAQFDRFKVEVDENTGVLTRVTSALAERFQVLTKVLIPVIVALIVFAKKLGGLSFENISNKFRELGGKLEGAGKRLTENASRLGKFRTKFAGQSVGANITKGLGGGKTAGRIGGTVGRIVPQLARLAGPLSSLGGAASSAGAGLAAFAGPLAIAAAVIVAYIAAVAAAVAALYVFQGVVDAISNVAFNAKNAIESGNVGRAGEAALVEKNAQLFNKLSIAVVLLTAAVLPVALPFVLLSAVVLKVANALGLLEPILNQIRNGLALFGLADNTTVIKAEADLAALRKRRELDAQKNARAVAAALQRVESGASSLAKEFEEGNLTKNLQQSRQELGLVEKLGEARVQQSQQAIGGKVAIGAAIGSFILPGLGTAVGAFIGGLIGMSDAAKENSKRIKENAEAQEKYTQDFAKFLSGTGTKLIRERAFAGVNDEQIAEQLRFKGTTDAEGNFKADTDDEGNKILTDLGKGAKGLSDAQAEEKRLLDIRSKDAEEGGKALTDDESNRLRTLNAIDERAKLFKETIEAAAKEARKLQELVKSLNFGLSGVIANLRAVSNSFKKLDNIDKVGNSFRNSLTDLETAFSRASGKLTQSEKKQVLDTIDDVLEQAGATETARAKAAGQFTGLSTALGRTREGTAEFKEFQKTVAGRGLSPENVKKAFKETFLKDIDPSVRKDLEAQIDATKFDDTALAKLGEGDVSPLVESLEKVEENFKKKIGGILEERAKIEDSLVKSIQNRQKAEEEFVAAQRKAIDIQLEAAKIFEEAGGARLTPEQKAEARRARFNAGADFAGISGLQGNTAADIQKVAAEIGNKFLQQETDVRAGAVAGQQRFTDASGQDEDLRNRRKTLLQDLIETTRSEIQARKEELNIIKEKNALERKGLEALLGGNIEEFLKQSSGAAAAEALRSGDSNLTGLFSASALGTGLKSLVDQQKVNAISRSDLRRAEDLTFAQFGLDSTGVFSGTTAEENAINAEIRDLAGTLGSLGQQAAEFERAEISTQTAIVNAKEVKLAEVGKQLGEELERQGQQNLARGGIVYASRGMFIPRGTDTVPAMLTPGEFVVNRAAVNRGNNLAILQAMNSGQRTAAMSQGGEVQYMFFGGVVQKALGPIAPLVGGLESLAKSFDPSTFTGIFDKFRESVERLASLQLNVTVEPTTVNVNFQNGNFLNSLKDEIRKELFREMGAKFETIGFDNSGKVTDKPSVLG